MINYWFRPVDGSLLTREPALRAMLITFFVTVALGIFFMFFSRRFRTGNPLAARQTNSLGNGLLWSGLIALLIAGCFSQNALFTWRSWLVLALLAIYAVIGYALYFYFTRYPELERQQREERERRRRYVPAPHTLARNKVTVSGTRSSATRRRRKTSR